VDPNAGLVDPTPVGPPMTGLHVVGNRIENATGQTVHLHGVNRSGTEYMCVQTGAIFDGPYSWGSMGAVTSWKINAIRVPLNESCWLGINGAPPGSSGIYYKQAIRDYVEMLHRLNIVPILELHWIGPGTRLATRLHPMPDLEHAPAFWTDVAQTFLEDDGVILELFNEPYPDRNRDSEVGWQCWRDGCTTNVSGEQGQTYPAVGFQALVDSVRATGSRHLILLGGLQYSNALSRWQEYAPIDPLGNLAAAWHVYNFNACASATCWDAAPATLALTFPVVVTELGQNDCGGTFVQPFLQWLDGHGMGYLAWTWNAFPGGCRPDLPMQPGQPWPLIADYLSGAPASSYAETYRDHLAQQF
jgi:hypothetical protein